MLGDMIAALSNWMYTYLLVILLVAAGLFFTVRNRFPQLRLLRESIRVVVERPEKEGSVSSFQALMVSTASRVGTGNIIGVSVAICIGGYGAVFWMWLIAIIGGATAFTESTLAQIYKRRNPETGESYGGPAYYIEAALHSRPLAMLFALSLIATYAGGFNMLCSYQPPVHLLRLRLLQRGASPPGSSAASWPCSPATASWAAASGSSPLPPPWCPSWAACMCWWPWWSSS